VLLLRVPQLHAGPRRSLAASRARFPGCGYSDTPENFAYDFDGYADFLARFADRLGLDRFALYLHDFGSQIGLRLAIGRPDRIAALIIQNGDIYEDQLGPKYAPSKNISATPRPKDVRSSTTP
jgi:pimeloyl-ACP methyl ester carboxylesterase